MIKANPTPYGIKAVRQIKTNREPSKRHTKKVSDTYEFFLSKVDPVISACITHLLLEQPEPNEIPTTMLEFLTRAGPSLEVEVIPGQKALHRSRKELKLYLATHIGPVIAKLVNHLAIEQPDNVIGFMKTELRSMGAQTIASTAPEQLEATTARSSTAGAASFNQSESASNPANRPSTATGTVTIEKEIEIQQNTTATSTYIVENQSIIPEEKPATIDVPIIQEKNIQIAVFGLGGAGKSSIINRLQGSIDKVRPTIGFRPVGMKLSEEIRVRFYDLGGGKKIRDIWNQYYHDVHGIVFVVDSSLKDESAVKECAEVFANTMKSQRLVGKPLLLLANKQDVENPISAEQWRNILFPSGETVIIADDGRSHTVDITFKEVTAHVPEGATLETHTIDPRIEESVETILEQVLSRFDDLQHRVDEDTKQKSIEEAQKRIARDRKVLKNKIACAFADSIDSTFAADNHIAAEPDKIFSEEEGLSFLCGEIDVELSQLPQIAVDVAKLSGNHQLALQLIGGLKAPISKKKTPLEWQEIYDLIVEIREELGLPRQ